jgi:hypothetical protein
VICADALGCAIRRNGLNADKIKLHWDAEPSSETVVCPGGVVSAGGGGAPKLTDWLFAGSTSIKKDKGEAKEWWHPDLAKSGLRGYALVPD